MVQEKQSFRFELDKEMAQRFKEKLLVDGYKTAAEWFRERVRDYLGEKGLSIE